MDSRDERQEERGSAPVVTATPDPTAADTTPSEGCDARPPPALTPLPQGQEPAAGPCLCLGRIGLIAALSLLAVCLGGWLAALTAMSPWLGLAAACGIAAGAAVCAYRFRARLRQLEEALDFLEHGFALYDAGDRLVLCNRAYRQLYPRSAARIVPGARFADLIRYGVEQGEYVEAKADPEGWIAMRLARHAAADGSRMLQPLADGRILSVSEHRTRDGGRVGLRVDVTDLERSRQALAESEMRFRTLAEHAPIGIWQLDQQGRTLYANPALCRLLGQDPAALAQPLASLLPPAAVASLQALLAAGNTAAVSDFALVLPVAGEERHLRVLAVPLRSPAGDGLLLILLDTTAQCRMLAELEHLALHDPLTGLENRRAFERQVEAWLARGERFALLLIDLDELEEFNARFGHAQGDRLLVACGERLRRILRTGDVIARVDGDEFALLVRGIADAEAVAGVMARVASSLAVLEAEGEPGEDSWSETMAAAAMRPTVCIAAVLAPVHGQTRERLLANAEFALSLAKQRGRGQSLLYEPALARLRKRRLELRRRLECALELGELELFAQPQIDLADGRPRGAEILLRWFDAVEKEPVPPAEFVPLAEESGLAIRLDLWVLEQVCSWLADGGAEHLPQLAVNVSAAHVTRPEFARQLADLLARYALSPNSLEIEVTEHVVLADRVRGRQFLEDLHALGISLALDDFGTGYSSLCYLVDLPFDRLKIDRSFIAGLENDRHRRAIVRAILGLARGLDMEVVAEGVETATQLAILLAEGCPLAQGYLIARPMPLAQLKPWLRSWDASSWRQQHGRQAASGGLEAAGKIRNRRLGSEREGRVVRRLSP